LAGTLGDQLITSWSSLFTVMLLITPGAVVSSAPAGEEPLATPIVIALTEKTASATAARKRDRINPTVSFPPQGLATTFPTPPQRLDNRFRLVAVF